MCLFNENNGNKIIYNIFILFYYSESKINTYIHLYIYTRSLFQKFPFKSRYYMYTCE